jgi:cell wall-associated NlpC family hydrolase
MRYYLFIFLNLLKQLARKRFMYFVLAVIFLVILADNYSEAHKNRISSRATRISSPPVKENIIFENTNKSSKVDSLVVFALSLEGIPYQYGGKSLNGFDCSGFTYYVYNKFGVTIPAGSANQYLKGEPIEASQIRKGDLLFFTGTQKGDRSVGHVGIAISDEMAEDVEFVHSSSGGGGRGVTVNSLEHTHYKARFLGARRVVDPS